MRPFSEPYKNGEYVSFFKRLKIYFSKDDTETKLSIDSVSTRIDYAVRRVDELGDALRCELLSMDEAANAFSKLSYDLNYINSMYIRKEDLNK